MIFERLQNMLKYCFSFTEEYLLKEK